MPWLISTRLQSIAWARERAGILNSWDVMIGYRWPTALAEGKTFQWDRKEWPTRAQIWSASRRVSSCSRSRTLAYAFQGFNLIDKDFSWNEFCFMMNCDRGAASEVWTTAKVGLIGDELLATR